MSATYPPVPSAKALSAALDGFAAALGPAAVLTVAGGARGVPRSVRVRHLGRVHGLGGREADDGGGHPGGLADRQRAQGAAVDARAGPQQRLRRPRAARARVGDRQPARHEPRARDQRGVRLRGRRARRALVRSLRRDPGGRPQAVALDRRPRLGQRDRQHARARRDVPAVRPGHGGAVRHGGRARQRRGAAHGHGRDARQRVVARLQARPRPDARPAVHAVELRHRHEDGHLADAGAPGLHAVLGARLEGRRHRAHGRHAAHAAARPHDRGRAVALQHALPRLGALEPLAVVRRRRARSPTR